MEPGSEEAGSPLCAFTPALGPGPNRPHTLPFRLSPAARSTRGTGLLALICPCAQDGGPPQRVAVCVPGSGDRRQGRNTEPLRPEVWRRGGTVARPPDLSDSIRSDPFCHRHRLKDTGAGTPGGTGRRTPSPL